MAGRLTTNNQILKNVGNAKRYFDLLSCLHFIVVFSSKTVEYKCSTVYLGRIYRHEQSDIAYQCLLLSAQRIVERPGVKIFGWGFFCQYEVPTTYRWWMQLPCLPPCSLHSNLPSEDGESKRTDLSISYFWTILRPVCYLYFSTIHKHLTDHRYDSPPCTGLLLLSFKKIINTLILSTNCLARKLGFVHLQLN